MICGKVLTFVRDLPSITCSVSLREITGGEGTNLTLLGIGWIIVVLGLDYYFISEVWGRIQITLTAIIKLKNSFRLSLNSSKGHANEFSLGNYFTKYCITTYSFVHNNMWNLLKNVQKIWSWKPQQKRIFPNRLVPLTSFTYWLIVFPLAPFIYGILQ